MATGAHVEFNSVSLIAEAFDSCVTSLWICTGYTWSFL